MNKIPFVVGCVGLVGCGFGYYWADGLEKATAQTPTEADLKVMEADEEELAANLREGKAQTSRAAIANLTQTLRELEADGNEKQAKMVKTKIAQLESQSK